MKTIAILGWDGSPQLSLGTTPFRAFRRASLADQRPRSAPLVSPSVSFESGAPASSPFRPICDCSNSRLPRRSVVVKSSAFTLLEVLVATAVLALMMAFLFNLLGSSVKIWEIGNKKIEAAQAARIGLNIIANELKNAYTANETVYTSNGSSRINYANYFATNTPPNTIGLGNATISNNSHQIRFITSCLDSSDPLNEIGFQCIYMTGDNQLGMNINRSYLIRKRVTSSSAPIFITTYHTSANPTPTPTLPDWNPANGGWSYTSNYQSFQPIIENCIDLKFNYAYQSGNTVQWTDDPNNTPATGNYWRLPLGVLVTVKVIDSRTAEKINQISNSDPAASSNVDVLRLIDQGSVTMSRFIPFNLK